MHIWLIFGLVISIIASVALGHNSEESEEHITKCGSDVC